MAALDGLSVSVVMHCGDGCEIVVPKRQYIVVRCVEWSSRLTCVSQSRLQNALHHYKLIRKIVGFENWHKFSRNLVLLLEGWIDFLLLMLMSFDVATQTFCAILINGVICSGRQLLIFIRVIARLWHVQLLLRMMWWRRRLRLRLTKLVNEASLNIGSRLLRIFIVQHRNAWNLWLLWLFA